MKVIGIDPGITGAVAMIDDETNCTVEDLPTIADGKSRWIDADALFRMLLAWRDGGPSMIAFVERVHAMPKNGSRGGFSQGMTLGSILATLQLACVSIRLVAPHAWKRSMGLSTDKNASLDKARLLYPTMSLERQKDHNRSEALLIAHWGREQNDRN